MYIFSDCFCRIQKFERFNGGTSRSMVSPPGQESYRIPDTE